MRNKLFWDRFYKKKTNIKIPSSFAKFVKKKIKKTNKINILDVGCGNGRDTLFFIKNKIKAIGLDASKQAINLLNKNSKDKNIFICKDICKPMKKFIQKKSFTYIYARFFIHAINLKQERIFFSNCKKILKKDGQIFLEFRTIKDPFFKIGKKLSKYEYVSDHYRRFININLFKERIAKYGFKIKFIYSAFNLAKFKNENPHICRMILKKK